VQDGDVIRVPHEGPVVKISGAVNRPGSYELIKGGDLAEVLELADGISYNVARTLPLVVLRRNSDLRVGSIQVPMPPSGAPNLSLKHEDQITVPSTGDLQQTILLQGAIAGANQVDPFYAYIFCGNAKLLYRDIAIAPAAYRMVYIAFEFIAHLLFFFGFKGRQHT
jgi:hypothetical protein